MRVPLIWPSLATPPAEVEPIKDLYAHLTGLGFSVEAWEAALLLYQTALAPPVTVARTVASRWQWIACNECVLELYHLRSRLEKIQSVQLRKCPSLLTMVDTSALRAARKDLDKHFPGIDALRHATAHRGQNESHPEVHAPDGQYALSGFREPDRYSAPYQGRLYALDISAESLRLIDEVVTAYLAAFAGAAKALELQGHLD